MSIEVKMKDKTFEKNKRTYRLSLFSFDQAEKDQRSRVTEEEEEDDKK